MAASGLLLRPKSLDSFSSAGMRHSNSLPYLQDWKPIQVFVATLEPDSPMVPLEVSKSDIIDSIKLRVQSMKSSIEHQRLVCGGKDLNRNNRQMCFNRDGHGDVLNVMLYLSDLVSLTVRTVTGESFVYKVWQPGTLKDLKNTTSGKEEMPISLQFATLQGEYVEDSEVIEKLVLKGEAVLCITVHRPVVRSKSLGKAGVELFVTSQDDSSCPSPTVVDLPRVKSALMQQSLQSRNNIRPTVGKYSSFWLFRNRLSFGLSHRVRNLIEDTKMGLNAGQTPKLTPEGSGGVYLMKDKKGLKNVAVFKPTDEEPMAENNPRGFSKPKNGEGLKKGTRSGEGAKKEVLAYILDHPIKGSKARSRRDVTHREFEGFSGVPPTVIMKCYHEAFHYASAEDHAQCKAKIGSLQQYVPSISSCEDMGSSRFPVEEVHKITVLDLRLANADRNGGNILVCEGKDGALKLVPIDHGYCLPENFEECTFEWLYWPQAQKPYGLSALEYIMSLDADDDIALLHECGWNLRPKLARTLRISTMLLKKGAAAGLTPFQIGMIMSRGECLDDESPIELIIKEAEAESVTEQDFLDVVARLLDDHIAAVVKGR